jgi:cob(I)alamin adenosyltransferase
MQIETPPADKPHERPLGERRGLLIVHTGDGKGKSTAAFGLALRAHGRDKRVKIFQFIKPDGARFGEHRAFEQLEAFRPAPGRPKQDSGPLGGQEPQATWGPIIEGLGDGFSWKSRDLEHSAQLAREGWEKARAAILGGEYFMVILDEITYPLIYGWLPLDEVLATLRARPREVHVVLTGRRCPPELIELADTVTEMVKIKHAFNAGIPAQRGIED